MDRSEIVNFRCRTLGTPGTHKNTSTPSRLCVLWFIAGLGKATAARAALPSPSRVWSVLTVASCNAVAIIDGFCQGG